MKGAGNANGPLCIIPARGGSKRFPGKNVALLNGKPLIAYAIEVARESGVFEAVCVSSDDPEILDIASRWEADCAVSRPRHLASDTVQVKDVCAHVLRTFADAGTAYATFGLLLPTSPLRTAEDIVRAYDLLVSHEANFVLSLVPFSHPVQRAVWVPGQYVEPYFGIEHMQPTQALDTTYRHDGTVIFARTSAFFEQMEFYGTKAVPYFVPEERSVDIDHPIDLDWAEFLLGRADLPH